MRRPLASLLAAGFLLAASPAQAQEAPTLQEDVRALRGLAEQQAKQLDALMQKVDQLVEAQGKGGAPTAPPAAPAAPVPPPPPAPEIRKAEAVPEGPRHTVAKGETLTSIAKHYSIPIPDLQKANEIKDDRKLQIGQVLKIPATKTPETSPEKKENP